MQPWSACLLLVGLSLSLALPVSAGTTCRTTYDKTFQRYVTRCTDGRQYQSTDDKAFDRLITRPMPPWKPPEKPKR